MFFRNKRKGKRGLSVLLAALLVFGTAACGKPSGTDPNTGDQVDGVNEELAPEFVYAVDYLTVEGKEEFYNTKFVGNAMYAMSAEVIESPDGDEYRQSIKKFEIADGKLGEGQEALQIDEGTNLNQFYVTDQGELYLVKSVSPDSEEEETETDVYGRQKQQYFLVKYSAGGEKEFEANLEELAKDQDWFYVQQLAVDGKGRCYLYCNEELALFDETGSPAGKVSLENISWLNGIGAAKDGKIYASYYNREGNSSGYILSEVDFDKRSFGAKYENFVNGNGGFSAGVGADILVGDSNALYEYSLAEQKAEKILTWLDCDINGNSVNGYSLDQEGKILVMIRDWETNTKEIAVMKKVKADQVAKKEKITVGVMSADSQLARQVIAFNKSTDRYHIEVKEYVDRTNWSETSYSDAVTRFTNDITSGNGPDILDVSSIDIVNYVGKGAIEDLTPWLENSSVLKKSDFFESILQGGTYNGVLAYIPLGFSLNTLAAKSSEVGDKMGWTLSDMIAYAKAHPKTALMEYADKETMLQAMLMLNQERFIDMEKGECDLDSQDFKELLEFANSFPDDYESSDNRLTPYKLADGSLLLSNAYISRFEDVQSALAYFGDEKVTFIGYPSYQGGNGCLMSVQCAYAVSSKSNSKEGAWAFLESVLSKDISEEGGFFGFSSRKTVFEKQKEQALKVEYIYDENGEIWLDENGEPVIAGGGGSWSMIGDDGETWSYESHPVTQEEAAIVEKLLDGAICFSYRNDDEMMNIIKEEAQKYFKGDQSVDGAASMIQKRIKLYITENMD